MFSPIPCRTPGSAPCSCQSSGTQPRCWSASLSQHHVPLFYCSVWLEPELARKRLESKTGSNLLNKTYYYLCKHVCIVVADDMKRYLVMLSVTVTIKSWKLFYQIDKELIHSRFIEHWMLSVPVKYWVESAKSVFTKNLQNFKAMSLSWAAI